MSRVLRAPGPCPMLLAMNAQQSIGNEAVPIGRRAQSAVADCLSRVLRGEPSGNAVRSRIAASWQRSRVAGVAPALPTAPLVLAGDALQRARDECEWLQPLAGVLSAQRDGYIGANHMLAAFDAAGRMLTADGDPGTLEQLSQINFAPGGLWSEDAVGTNGPGTALALGKAVHVVGAEHYCEQWQQWHCASVPVRDPGTGKVVAVIDLSGSREAAHPYALTMATAIAVALEQRLGARDADSRTRLLMQYASLASRYPSDVVLAVDRTGRVLADSDVLQRTQRRLNGLGADGRSAMAELIHRAESSSPEDVVHPLLGARTAALHPVKAEGRVVAGCLVLSANRAAASRNRATTPSRGADTVSGSASGAAKGAGSAALSAAAGSTAFTASTTRYTLAHLIGDAACMHEVRRLARACARTDLPVLLMGESGTGKEVLAQSIHHASPRHAGAFVAVNCAAIPRDLMESELFGHASGAFTGARREGTVGKFQAADGGSLFLDEVAELSPAAQAALLRVLQEGEVTRLGEHTARPLDVRILAATNRDVRSAVADGRLRDDLFHRLNVLSITLPPLRDRREDIVSLAQRFLLDAPSAVPHTFAPAVLEALAAHDWPGNVRELRNVVHRMVALSESAELDLFDLPAPLRAQLTVGTASPDGTIGSNAAAAKGFAPVATGDPTDAARAHLQHVVSAHATMAQAAESLGITRSTLYRRLQRYGLTPGRSARSTPRS